LEKSAQKRTFWKKVHKNELFGKKFTKKQKNPKKLKRFETLLKVSGGGVTNFQKSTKKFLQTFSQKVYSGPLAQLVDAFGC
jgi:hypothetical protein